MTHCSSCLVTVALAPSLALGAETSWVSPTNASWSNPASWSAGVPGSPDTAVFSLTGPLRIVDVGNTAISVDRIRIAKGQVRFNGSASVDALGMNAFNASLTVGSGSLSTTSANWTSTGELRVGRLDVATGTQAIAELKVSSGTLDVLHDARIGVLGDGSLFLLTPSQYEWLELGSTSGGYGLVARDYNLAAAPPITVRSQCTVGKFGDGLASFSEGRFGALMLGQNAGSTGSASAGDLLVEGTVTVGHGGIGSLRISGNATCAGSFVLASKGNPVIPPYDPDAEGTLLLDGGDLHCGGEFTAGLGIAQVTTTGGGTLGSTNAIRGNSRTTVRTILGADSSADPVLSAPIVSLSAGTWTIEYQGTPPSEASWVLSRSWSGTAAPTIVGNPGFGREWRLIQCGTDLHLATAVPGEPDPPVCEPSDPLLDIPDPDADESRSFGSGGVAIGDGWFAVGCPGGDGSVDVFRRAGVTWIREARLAGPEGRHIGAAVAAHGSRLATYAAGGTAVVVYVRSDGGWTVEAIIPLDVKSTTTLLRDAIDLEADTLAVGVPHASQEGEAGVGRVDIFQRGVRGWVKDASVLPQPAVGSTLFGRRVELSGSRIAASQGGSSTNYVIAMLERNELGWSTQATIPGVHLQPFTLSGDVLTCMVNNPSSLTSMWRPYNGVWREIASLPGFSALAASPERLALIQSSNLRFLEPTAGGLWRLGRSMPISGSMMLETSSILTIIRYSDRVSVIDHVRATPCPADLNGDGLVNGADLGLVLSAWDIGPGGDLDGDGTTGGSDLGILLSAWGTCAP